MELHPAKDQEIGYIRNLYVRAFPRAERKPFEVILRMRRQGICAVYLIRQEGQPCGMATVITVGQAALLDYFAIDEAFRGQGLGGLALRELSRLYGGRPFFLEIERVDEKAGNHAQRLARRQFYLHHGFVGCGLFVRLFGVDMEILSYGGPVGWESCHSIYRVIYRPFYRLKVKRIS